MFLGFEAWSVGPTPIRTCRSSGASLSPAGLQAINMALLIELPRRFHTIDPCKVQRPRAQPFASATALPKYRVSPVTLFQRRPDAVDVVMVFQLL